METKRDQERKTEKTQYEIHQIKLQEIAQALT